MMMSTSLSSTVLERAIAHRAVSPALRRELAAYARERIPHVLTGVDPADVHVIEAIRRLLSGHETETRVVATIVAARATWRTRQGGEPNQCR